MSRRNAEPVIPSFDQSLSEESLLELVPKVDGWIIGDDPATAQVFHAGVRGRLRAAVKWGVGVDNVDFASAKQVGLDVVNTPGMFSEEVSDIVLGYTVGLARNLFSIDRGVRAGCWPKPVGISLKGKTASIVGYGNIGQATARKLIGLGLNIIVYDPECIKTPSAPIKIFPWPEKLDQADFLIFTCSLTPKNRGMLNARTLAACKKGVMVVNVSRGALIDESALADCIKSGKVFGAALDVFQEEPLPKGSPLRRFDACIFGSHNSSNTLEAVEKTSLKAIQLLFERLK
jgi:D-3-phosphoglycerate dehydrogenase